MRQWNEPGRDGFNNRRRRSLLRPLGFGDTFLGLATAIVPPVHVYRQLSAALIFCRGRAPPGGPLPIVFFVLMIVIGALEQAANLPRS